ncbi:MAG: hypothetical protein IKK25_05260 [Lentisphaeria bacterium]|nr:hypothetical protein [Lentisphaeria bacterium]
MKIKEKRGKKIHAQKQNNKTAALPGTIRLKCLIGIMLSILHHQQPS